MREIKFRAWDKKLKKWVSDLPFSLYGETFFLCGFGCTNPDKRNTVKDYLNDIEFVQYTGLKDKNWKEIYEGDILQCLDRYANKYNVIVEYINGSFMWDKEPFFCHLVDNKFIGEIIGNIYENPELIK